MFLTERHSKRKKKMARKRGFMTPERKKKLRTLLRKKAVEELKKEQVEKDFVSLSPTLW
jgi:hypothetical protein